jgi:predicted RNase H-like HicB family nuclease
MRIVYERGEDGWVVASIPDAPGVFSQGRTREQARANVLDALDLMRSPEPSPPPARLQPRGVRPARRPRPRCRPRS